MTVELISVGTEILLGNIVNTNAAFLSERCADLGLSCYYQMVVGDNRERLSEVLQTAIARSDVVILSGGLGPTEDDLTKETAAEVFGKKLVMHEPSLRQIVDFFKRRNLEMTDNNRKQALIPEGAMVVSNDNGTAPGIIIEENGKKMILLPGPPNELIPMFEKSMIPYLKQTGSETIYSKTVKICGVGESKAETMIKDMIDGQSNPTIAPYAKNCEVHLRVTAKAADETEAARLLEPVIKELENRFSKHIYTTDTDTTLEMAVAELLQQNKITLTTAESCTGGMLAARMINVPGISDVFQAGYITYSNKAKRDVLGVEEQTLQEFGAVSEQTAAEMAQGAARKSQSEAAVSITGIAGPTGGTAEKPVGLVYIGCCICGTITVKKYSFSGNRAKIRETAVSSALIQLRECLSDRFEK